MSDEFKERSAGTKSEKLIENGVWEGNNHAAVVARVFFLFFLLFFFKQFSRRVRRMKIYLKLTLITFAVARNHPPAGGFRNERKRNSYQIYTFLILWKLKFSFYLFFLSFFLPFLFSFFFFFSFPTFLLPFSPETFNLIISRFLLSRTWKKASLFQCALFSCSSLRNRPSK